MWEATSIVQLSSGFSLPQASFFGASDKSKNLKETDIHKWRVSRDNNTSDKFVAGVNVTHHVALYIFSPKDLYA